MEQNILRLEMNIKELDKLKDTLYKKREKFEEQNKELIEKVRKTSEIQDFLKGEIRVIACQEFKRTGNKKFTSGIGIRVGVSLIYETGEALGWAKEHCLALCLDKKRFEQLAKTEDMEFVTKEETITVTFPKVIKYEDE